MKTTYGPVTALTVTGMGEPGGTEHASAIAALYAVAGAMNALIGPLEGRWWVEDSRPALSVPRQQWRWHLHLPLPIAPEPGEMEAAREAARPSGMAVDRVQVVTFTEGECVEMLHEGPYSQEHVTLAAMQEYMDAHHLVANGLHHEVYLSDLRDGDPAKMRTVLRQPVRSAATA
ncbi:GyrI-like domain-containing protein [Nonomuraea sp. NPDC059194]|uniref:GyrI-like domain-containing protein n=1 Tax=Nonomuraea sp. NPDC059194 TaxID=3346764 RepID=UPI0036A83240